FCNFARETVLQLPCLLFFPPFRLDPVNEQLWRETREVPLRRKTFAVLRYLVEHPGQLVTKEELLAVLWPKVRVTDVVVMGCIRDLRRALGDNRKTPQFIQTIQGRGYRFIGTVISRQRSVAGGQCSGVRSQKSQPIPSFQSPILPIVDRETELQRLHERLAKALQGERQVVFVTGEAGIGKTTVVEAFLKRVATDGNVWVARGQCVEHYGRGEAYLP